MHVKNWINLEYNAFLLGQYAYSFHTKAIVKGYDLVPGGHQIIPFFQQNFDLCCRPLWLHRDWIVWSLIKVSI